MGSKKRMTARKRMFSDLENKTVAAFQNVEDRCAEESVNLENETLAEFQNVEDRCSPYGEESADLHAVPGKMSISKQQCIFKFDYECLETSKQLFNNNYYQCY